MPKQHPIFIYIICDRLCITLAFFKGSDILYSLHIHRTNMSGKWKSPQYYHVANSWAVPLYMYQDGHKEAAGTKRKSKPEVCHINACKLVQGVNFTWCMKADSANLTGDYKYDRFLLSTGGRQSYKLEGSAKTCHRTVGDWSLMGGNLCAMVGDSRMISVDLLPTDCGPPVLQPVLH